MDFTINYVAVVVATVAAIVVSGLWYSPLLFIKPWLALVGQSEQDMKKGFGKSMALSIVGAFLKAWVVACFAFAAHAVFKHSYFHDALFTAITLWVCLSATQTIMRNSFEKSPGKLTAIILGCDFVVMLVIGLVIASFGI